MGLLIFRIRTSREAAADNREATKTMVEAMRQMGKMVAEHDRWLAEDGGGVPEGLLEALAAAGLDPEKSYGLLAELAAALTPKDAGDAKLSASAPSGYRPPPGGLGEGAKPGFPRRPGVDTTVDDRALGAEQVGEMDVDERLRGGRHQDAAS